MRIFYTNISEIDLNNTNVYFGHSYEIFLRINNWQEFVDGLLNNITLLLSAI